MWFKILWWYFWPAVALGLALALTLIMERNQLLEDNRELYLRTLASQDALCTHVMYVNRTCEENIELISKRLGIENTALPKMSTLLWSTSTLTTTAAKRFWSNDPVSR